MIITRLFRAAAVGILGIATALLAMRGLAPHEQPVSRAVPHPSMTHTRTWLAAHVADLRLSGASLAPEAAPEAVDRRVDDPRNDAGAAGSGRTVASWYDQRPFACFDDEGRHDLPRGIGIWVAHRTLPCGTPVLVIAGDRSVVAHVWDRGPFVEGRALDLSKRAFALLAPPSRGVIEVRWRVLGSA